MTESKVMKALHDIRRRHFEEIKHMSVEERLTRLHRETEVLVKLIQENRRHKLELQKR
jgi:hypothetical protein